MEYPIIQIKIISKRAEMANINVGNNTTILDDNLNNEDNQNNFLNESNINNILENQNDNEF